MRRIAMPIVILFLLFSAMFSSGSSAIASADKYLCEYGMRLYREGNIDEAIQEFKKALLANPNNLQAREELRKILGYLESQEQPRVGDGEKEKIAQLNSQIEELFQQKMMYQELVQKKEGELRFSEGREKGNIEQLKSEVERLQKERENDEERLAALQNEKCKTLQLASQITQLSNEKQQRNEEIAQKGKALSDLKAKYESQIDGLRALLRQQEQKIDALSLDKRALLEENMRIEREQLAEIERLISMIEAGNELSLLD